MIHVALCFHDGSGEYYKHALVTALSVLDNAKGRLCLHVVHDDTLTATAEAAFNDICARYGQELCLHSASALPPEAVANMPPSIGCGTLYRTMLPDLLEVDKVLYLDCDIVCLADVADIYSLNISNNFLGASKMPDWQARRWIAKHRIPADFCVNVGVLLMNLARIRRDMPDFTWRYAALAADPSVRACDQTATNLLFNSIPAAYTFLPEEYNLRTELADHAVWALSEYRGKVLHFAGKKPWQVLTQPAFFYWKYYARLFPSEDVFALMEKLAPHEQAYLLAFLLRDAKRMRWVRRFYDFAKLGLWGTLKKRLLP